MLDLKDLGDAHIRVDGVEGDDETDLGESAARVFVGQSQRQPHGRVFGGQVLAQSVIAAGRTVQRVGEDGPARSTRSTATSCTRATTGMRPGCCGADP